MNLKLTQYIKQHLGREWSMKKIEALTEGTLSKRTANNWYNGDKRPILDLVLDGIKYRSLQQAKSQEVEGYQSFNHTQEKQKA